MDGSALTPFAWFFMLLSMGAVTSLTAYCFYRILSAPRLQAGGRETPRGPAGAGAGEPGGPPGGGPAGGGPAGGPPPG